MKVAFPVLLTSAIMLFAVACGGNGSPSSIGQPDRLVPSDANVIGQIQIAEILADVDFESLYSEAPKDSDVPGSFDDLLNEAKKETGIDFREIKQAVVFSDVTQGKDYAGIIAQGSFDQEKLLATLNNELESPLAVVDYKGQEIYEADESEDIPSISFIGGDTLVAGTVPAIQGDIDVQRGEKSRLTGKVYDAFEGLGQPLVRMAMEVPPEALAEFNDAGGAGFGMPVAMEAIQNLEVFSFALDKPGDEVKVEAQLDFRNEGSATELADTLDGFLSLAKGFAPSNDLRDVLDKLELNVAGAKLTILLQVAIADLEQAARSLEGNLSPAPRLGH